MVRSALLALAAVGGCTHFELEPALEEPAYVSVTAGIEEASVRFQPVSDATSYRIFVARSAALAGSEDDPGVRIVETEASPARIPALQSGEPWYVRVRARRGSTESAATPALAVRTLASGWFETESSYFEFAPDPTGEFARRAMVADLNGDDRADLVIAMPLLDEAGDPDAGRVELSYGRAGGWPPYSDSIFSLAQPDAHYGAAVAAGDVDCDGIDDLLIGAPGVGLGLVQVHYGRLSGIGGAPDTLTPTPAAGGFGRALATGDVDADGCADVVVGHGSSGMLHVYLGSGDGPTGAPQDIAPIDGSTGTGWGDALAAADVDGDGDDDLVVGEPRWNGTGRVSVLLAPDFAEVHTLEGATTDARFGIEVIAGGDVDRDGYEDFLVADRPAGSGALHLVRGGPVLVSSPLPPRGPPGARAPLAATFADVDGDGFDDVLAGNPDADAGSAEVGTVALFLGGPAGLSSSAAWSVSGDEAGAEFGASLAAGDMDGDGWLELLVGAPLRGSGAGRLFGYRGLRSRGPEADAGLPAVTDGNGNVSPLGATFRDRDRGPHRCEWAIADGTAAVDPCDPAQASVVTVYVEGEARPFEMRLRVRAGEVFGEAVVRGRKE